MMMIHYRFRSVHADHSRPQSRRRRVNIFTWKRRPGA